MSTATIVWIVVVVIVVIALAAIIAGLAHRKRLESKRSTAQSIREETTTSGAQDIAESRVEAQEAEARAARARLEAESAEAEAADAHRGSQVNEARYEDRLREADRVDPDVDHTADDYQPMRPTDGDRTT
jgi:hypothetical protein